MPDAAAFFDVDGTLVGRNIVHHYVYIRRRLLPRLVRDLWTGAFLAKAPYYLVLDKVSRSRLNISFFRNYRGLRGDAVRGCAQACFEDVIRPHLFGEAGGRIAEEQAAGRRIVLVTGSINFLIEPLARFLGADDMVAPGLVERDGRFTGDLDGPPIGEAEKAKRIRDYAQREGVDLAASSAYGDSIADLPMLEAVGHPHVVNPDRALASTARQRGWPVLHWAVASGGKCTVGCGDGE